MKVSAGFIEIRKVFYFIGSSYFFPKFGSPIFLDHRLDQKRQNEQNIH